jgi:diguanylate cyclase (GGDEF)-like protein
MPLAKLANTLEKVASLTSERDSDALQLELTQALFTIADVKNMTIHSAGNIKRAQYAISHEGKLPKDAAIEADLIGLLGECLETSKIINIPYEEKRITLYPLFCSNKQSLAVILIEETADAHHHDLTIPILKIYHNFVALINDNERDTLTGLLNRKTFDLKINNIISTLRKNQEKPEIDKGEPSYLAIFDIDHFKRVNDNHGHLIGDEVLLLFSQLMNKKFRDQDLLFRFGGEEFVGVFQCPDDHTMTSILNRFRKTVAVFEFPQAGRVTVSCGFTRIDPFGFSSNIIDRADIALYQAKNSGRNQVFQHEHLVASGVLSETENNNGEIELF